MNAAVEPTRPGYHSFRASAPGDNLIIAVFEGQGDMAEVATDNQCSVADKHQGTRHRRWQQLRTPALVRPLRLHSPRKRWRLSTRAPATSAKATAPPATGMLNPASLAVDVAGPDRVRLVGKMTCFSKSMDERTSNVSDNLEQ
jgi:hypothetical protein